MLTPKPVSLFVYMDALQHVMLNIIYMKIFTSYISSAQGQYVSPGAEGSTTNDSSDMQNVIFCSFYHILQL